MLQKINVRTLQAFVTATAATGVTRKSLENILQTVFSDGTLLPKPRAERRIVPRADLMLPREEGRPDVRFMSAKDLHPPFD